MENITNLSATWHNIRALLNPENYPPSYKATLTRRATLTIAFYLTIVVVSLFGNLLICYVVFKRKRMRISTNLLMTNLALSDLLMTCINIPFNIARILLEEWPFGSFLCILVPFVQVTSVYVSTLTMTIIAIDRYQAIINPLNKRITTHLPTVFTILFIWIVSGLFSIPNVVFNRVVEIADHTDLHRCRAIYPKPKIIYRRSVTLFTFLTQYAIPLSITTFAYIRISFYIWSRLSKPKSLSQNHLDDRSNHHQAQQQFAQNSKYFTLSNHNHHHHHHHHCHKPQQQQEQNQVKSFQQAASNNSTNKSNSSTEYSFQSAVVGLSNSNKTLSQSYQFSINQLRERSRRKSIKMLALVVGVFSICWLPLNIYHLNSDFSSASNLIQDPNIFFICHWFAMSSVCYNPFIYFWLNHHYRQEIKHLIRCTNLFCFLTFFNKKFKKNSDKSPQIQGTRHHPEKHSAINGHHFDLQNRNPKIFRSLESKLAGDSFQTQNSNQNHCDHHHKQSDHRKWFELDHNNQLNYRIDGMNLILSAPSSKLNQHHHHHRHNHQHQQKIEQQQQSNQKNLYTCDNSSDSLKIVFRTRFNSQNILNQSSINNNNTNSVEDNNNNIHYINNTKSDSSYHYQT
ncbi:Amiloride-sensitive cation channel 5 [Sarcoptes scabiei]|nr:Amiloride-sensitive cation channel 5 [Sarcoptes scabiei]